MSIKVRTKELKDKGKSLYLDIYMNGVRKYEFLSITINKTDTPEKKKEKIALANHIRSQREIEINSEGSTYIPSHYKKVDILQFYQAYLDSYTKKDKRMIRYSFEKFQHFLNESQQLKSGSKFLAKQLTKVVCEEFKEYLTSDKAGLKGETPLNYFTRFKKVLRTATKQGIFKESPADGVNFKRSDENTTLKKQILTIDELRLLHKTECGNEQIKNAFLFACHTGLGMAELKELRWSNIDNNRLLINRAKTQKNINIKLSESALSLIGERGKTDEKVFQLSISDQAISKDLKRWVKRAGIEKNISFYCGRHTYAVLLLMNNNNLKTVADAMGQSSTRHTLKYLNFVDSLKDQATSNLPSIF